MGFNVHYWFKRYSSVKAQGLIANGEDLLASWLSFLVLTSHLPIIKLEGKCLEHKQQHLISSKETDVWIYIMIFVSFDGLTFCENLPGRACNQEKHQKKSVKHGQDLGSQLDVEVSAVSIYLAGQWAQPV